MATNKKANECGWFYHAPARCASQEEPVGAPPASQIPGLNDPDLLDPVSNDAPKPLYRDTDTKYIRLAKQGGRPDLLQMKRLPGPSKEAKRYPRTDWFYLEDNAAEDAALHNGGHDQNGGPYEFRLPEYMVNQPRQSTNNGDNIDAPVDHDGSAPNSRYNKRSPYAFDAISAHERHGGDQATDKMAMKIPEAKKYGYGVRQGKNLPVKKVAMTTERVKPAMTSQASDMDSKPKYQPLPNSKKDTDGVVMSKLLSHGYEQDWHNRVQRWQSKQDKARETLASMNAPVDSTMALTSSEIGGHYNNATNHSRNSSATKSRRAGSDGRDADKGRTEATDQEKEIFKLSRFKNIPPKVDDHQKPEFLKTAAVH